MIFKTYSSILFFKTQFYVYNLNAVCVDISHSLYSVIFLQICHAIKSRGYAPVRDPEGRIGPYAYKGNQWVSYDDVSDIRRKVSVVQF